MLLEAIKPHASGMDHLGEGLYFASIAVVGSRNGLMDKYISPTGAAPKEAVTMRNTFSRRDFILTGAVGTGAIAVGLANSGNRASSMGLGGGSTTVVARKNGSVAEMVQGCVNRLGGMGFVSGRKVVVKVNGSWRNPEADTSPEVVRQVCLVAAASGASQVKVYDHTIQGGPSSPSSSWKSIASAAQSAGAHAVILGNDSSDYVARSVSGVSLTTAEIAKVLDQADVLINVPKLKTHSGAGVSASLKNHLGTARDRGAIHSAGLSQAIADLNTCSAIRGKHRLSIVDAIEPMVTEGPSTGTHASYNGILAGTDPVAVDYIGTQIIRRYNPGLTQNPSHITKASQLGLGTNDPASIDFDEADVGMPVPELPLALPVAGAIGLALMSRRLEGKRSG